MKTNILILSLALGCSMVASANDTIQVNTFRHVGPFALSQPVMMDSTNVDAKAYDAKDLLTSKINFEIVSNGEVWSGVELPNSDSQAMHLLGFQVNNSEYFVGKVKVQKGPADLKLFQDGYDGCEGEVKLRPGSHNFVLKYISDPNKKDSLQLVFISDSVAKVSVQRLDFGLANEQKQLYTIEKMQEAKRYSTISISPNGNWIITCESITREDWSDYDFYLWNRLTGNKMKLTQNSHWMPKSNKFYQIRHVNDKSLLVVVDPETMAEEVWVKDLPCDYFSFLPTEDRLLMSEYQHGPKELESEAFSFVHPDDRQEGWRDRSYLSLFDIKTGLKQQLTFGFNNVWCPDIRYDGKKILVAKTESRLTARPTTLMSFYELDLETHHIDTLVNRDGFVNNVSYSPDGKQILIAGSPECLGGVGNIVPEGMTPSMIDVRLYKMNLSDKQIVPLTKDFAGIVNQFEWSPFDNKVYFTSEKCDSLSLYVLDPKNGSIRLVEQPEEIVDQFSLAMTSGVIAFSGESNNHSWRLYNMEIGKKNKGAKLMEDLNAAANKLVDFTSAEAWVCKNSIGDDVHCRYYLPNNFNASAKYPMIVYYYGGCSGTLRHLEMSYPWATWAAQGYVVLVVNPSGATGFGQEWAARHVNTAGVDPARDIIEATKTFCDQHAFVNRERLGCIGASYGGFMTQYLQTVTDIFRCAISHAGISDHSNYWGYGDWGYTYSEVSMANTYPWTRKDLYVDRSPLYNVDKIKSSMLFLHGTEDNNVPYNNSLQMYTALKLLGQDVAMVSIKGEKHGIRKPSRRRLWHNATMAWFARCLKDDPTWWDTLYPKRTL